MGNSTISVQNVFDRVAAKGIPIPLAQPSGYSTDLAISMANDVMCDLIAERFNWKWNRVIGAAFYTNSYQQDYPQIGLTDVGWGEDADRIDVNNTSFPKPLKQLTFRRQLSRAGIAWAPVAEICWMYNKLLFYPPWPGPGVTFNPLITTLVKQNPAMNMVDAHGNFLVVTQIGTTGTTAPSAPAASPEGTQVPDGTVTWTVVDPMSQGWRVSPLPGAAGPVWQIIPYYQAKAPAIKLLQQKIDPIPDDFSRHYQEGMEAYCLAASPNPGDRERGILAQQKWMAALDLIKKQGDREVDSYAALPATVPVENVYAWVRNPQDPSQPY
jgi:hypothetical protein